MYVTMIFVKNINLFYNYILDMRGIWFEENIYFRSWKEVVRRYIFLSNSKSSRRSMIVNKIYIQIPTMSSRSIASALNIVGCFFMRKFWFLYGLLKNFVLKCKGIVIYTYSAVIGRLNFKIDRSEIFDWKVDFNRVVWK